MPFDYIFKRIGCYNDSMIINVCGVAESSNYFI